MIVLGRKAGIMTKEEEKRRCREIQEMILREMDCNNGVTDEEILEYIEEQVLEMGHTVYLSLEQKEEMIRTIFNSIRKLDVLQKFWRIAVSLKLW